MSDEDVAGLEGVGEAGLAGLRQAAAQAQSEWDERDAAAEAERVAMEQAAAEQAAAEAGAAEGGAAEAGEAKAETETETAETAAGGGAEEGASDGER
jgi:hypothetical protein